MFFLQYIKIKNRNMFHGKKYLLYSIYVKSKKPTSWEIWNIKKFGRYVHNFARNSWLNTNTNINKHYIKSQY